MILCRCQGNWFLTTGTDSQTGKCWVRCGPRMPHPPNFKPLPPTGAMLYGTVELNEEVRFYQRLQWQGLTISPVMWNRDSESPLLLCRIETHQLRARSEQEYLRLVDDMRVLGWSWDLHEGGHRYLHVDELEKVEGVAPTGPV